MILTKKKMKKIAGIYEKEICAKVPDHEEYNYEFSSEFDEKMHSMILGAEIRPIKKTARAGKRAVGAAVAAAVICIMLGFSTEVRATVASWFRHHREDDPKTVVYEFNEDYTEKKLPQIIIGWLPDEFEDVEPIDTSNAYRFSRAYVHDNKVIDFTIDYMHKGGKMYIIPEEGEDLILEEMIINGNKAELWYDSMSCSMNIFDDTHGILIEIDSNIEKEQIIRIAENIQFVFE